MRIHRVRIDNFRCLRDFDVSFCAHLRHAEQHEPPAPLIDDLGLFFERIGAAMAAA